MLSFVTSLMAVAMTAVALWRLPALRYDEPQRRALWACSAGFAAALWCRVPAVKDALNHSPITDLSVLVKYLTSMVAILGVLRYMTAIYSKAQKAASGTPRYIKMSRRVGRLANAGAFGAVAAMIVIFFTVVDRSLPSVDFATDHAGQWGAATFISILYVYLGSASATCAYQWGRASLRAETRLLRVGLGLMTLAVAIYTLYSAFRIVTVWAPISASSEEMRIVADSSNLTVACLWAVGASIPSTKAVVVRWTSWRSLDKLYPLWRELTDAFPDIPLQPPASRRRELLRTSPSLEVRLDRCTQDIADVVEQLRHHATPALLSAAEAAAEAHPDPEPAAEAFWIKSALFSARAGHRSPIPARGLLDKPLTDSHAESHWLARVQDVYASISDEQVKALLDQAGRPGDVGVFTSYESRLTGIGEPRL